MDELELVETPLDEVPDLSEIEVDELLGRVATLKEFVGNKQNILDSFTAHYQTKIERAQEIYEQETSYARRELASLNDCLARWARKHITGKKRSLNLPSGTLKLTRQQPQFFVDGEPAANSNPMLVELARRVDDTLIKTKVVETADWAELKKRLSIADDGNVYLKDTGELVDGMTGKFQADKFEVILT